MTTGAMSMGRLAGRPHVSVVIPARNHARWLGTAIASALEQSYGDLEVIVVDDASSDETPAVLERWRGRLRALRQEHGGPAAARNRGIAHARGALIGFLDADDVWAPDKLARQVPALERHLDAGFAYGPLDIIESVGDRDRHQGVFGRPPGADALATLSKGNVVPTSSVLMARASLERLGGFDESLTTPGCEDYDLWLRAARSGPLVWVRSILGAYRLHGGNAVGLSAERARAAREQVWRYRQVGRPLPLPER